MEQGTRILASSPFGDIIERGPAGALISVSGKPIAEERDFLFGYDISAHNPGYDGNGGCDVELAVATIIAGTAQRKLAEVWAKAIAKYPLEG